MLSLMAKIPFYAVNIVAFVWIFRALKKTISILTKTKQSFKLKLFNNFYFAVMIISGILIFGGFLQLFLLMFKGFDTSFLRLVSYELLPTLFSIIIFSIMLTMRPTTKSKLLANHAELQEENTEHSVDHEYGPHRASVVHYPSKEMHEENKYYGDKLDKVRFTSFLNYPLNLALKSSMN